MILVNIGSGNGLMPNGIKPLPEPMLSFDHKDPKKQARPFI